MPSLNVGSQLSAQPLAALRMSGSWQVRVQATRRYKLQGGWKVLVPGCSGLRLVLAEVSTRLHLHAGQC